MKENKEDISNDKEKFQEVSVKIERKILPKISSNSKSTKLSEKELLEKARNSGLKLKSNYEAYSDAHSTLSWECLICGYNFLDSWTNISRRKFPCENCKDKEYIKANDKSIGILYQKLGEFLDSYKDAILLGLLIPSLENIVNINKDFEPLKDQPYSFRIIQNWLKENTKFSTLEELKENFLEEEKLKNRLRILLNAKKEEILSGDFIPTSENIASFDKDFDFDWSHRKYLYNIIRWWVSQNTSFESITKLKESYLGAPKIREIRNLIFEFLEINKSNILNGIFEPCIKNIPPSIRNLEKEHNTTRISYIIYRWLKENTPFGNLEDWRMYFGVNTEVIQLKNFLNLIKIDIVNGKFIPTRQNILSIKKELANLEVNRFNNVLNYWLNLNTNFKNITELKEFYFGKDIGKRLKEYLDSRREDILSGIFIPTKYNLRKIDDDFANYQKSYRSVSQWLNNNTNGKIFSISDLIKNFLSRLSYRDLGFVSEYTLQFNDEEFRVKKAWFQVVKKSNDSSLIQINQKNSPKTWTDFLRFLKKNNDWKFVDLLAGEIFNLNDWKAFHHIDGNKSNDDFFNLCFLIPANHAIITAAQKNWEELKEFFQDLLISNFFDIVKGIIPESWKSGWRKLAIDSGLKLPLNLYAKKELNNELFVSSKLISKSLDKWFLI